MSAVLAEPASPARAAVGARDLFLALVLAFVGALGAWPGANGEPDPLALIVWLAIVAVPAGAFAGASGLRLWPIAPVVPACWLVAIGLADGLSRRDLPSPVWVSVAVCGLFAFGFACGRVAPALRWRGTAALLLCASALSSAPLLGLLLRAPFSARVNAFLLDLSPPTLLAECAGLDWMRHPIVYEAANTIDIDPGLRAARSAPLAGGIVFVVGCALAVLAERRARRVEARAIP